MLYQTQGIILKKTDFGEFDRILTVYTRSSGKISLLVQGVRKPKAKLKSQLSLFNLVDLMIAPGRQIDRIVNALIIKDFSSIRHNVKFLATLYCLTEIFESLVFAPEKDENLWHFLMAVWAFFEDKPSVDLKFIINYFTERLLKELGYGQHQRDESIEFVQNLIGRQIKSLNVFNQIIR